MHKKTIFVVEDDPDISELMRLVIESEDYVVKNFLDTEKVFSSITRDKPKLIIMDLWISGVDSSVLIKKIKNTKATAHIPVVIVSAKNYLDKTVRQTNADGFLAKPFNISDLIAITKKFA